ncbi:hypothetical protein [Actinoallomurus sp. CA-142502]|uniref:hypothetical protein n=1 Tax=Actinoallomurus sp. CA-142502 TaxID=3239885 RepID=UPI003D8FB853
MVHVQRFPYHPLLGRHMLLDDRSLPYAIERQETPPTIKPVDHPISIPILDQSNLLAQGIHVSQLVPGATDVDGLGSCTCNAGTYSLSTSPALSERVRAAGEVLDERFAIRLYPKVTRADEYPDVAFPPTDCGSSGLGVCKVLKARGLIGSYTWATTLEGVAALLQRGSIMFGAPWYEAWFEPGPDGFVDEGGWESSEVAGGHEFCVVALETWDERAPENSVIRFPNSWNRSWGDNGYGRMRLATYARLRAQIDVKQIRV